MLLGFLGKKIGMTQVFAENGGIIPVTIIEAGPCVVTQVRTKERDGYEAVQLGFGDAKRLNKPMAGHLKNLQKCRYLREVKVENISEFQEGQKIGVNIFQPGEKLDIIGRSKGRGFAGVVKRHGFAGGPRTHGQSDRTRAPGSIGAGTFPGRVAKGMRMAGHMGDEKSTVKNLEVVRIDPGRNLLFLNGGVPGASNSLLVIRRTGKTAAVGS